MYHMKQTFTCVILVDLPLGTCSVPNSSEISSSGADLLMGGVCGVFP